MSTDSKTITWNATDASGNAAVPVVQRVTVRDCEKPVIAAVSDITRCNDAGLCSAVVAVTAPSLNGEGLPDAGKPSAD